MGALNVPDEMVMNPATKLVVDYTGLYETWAEEYPYPTFDTWFLIGRKFTDMIHDKKLDFKRMENLGAILNGKLPGRDNDQQVIIYSIGGMPVEDVAWGKTVYENAIKMEIGTKLNLWEEPYLF